MKRLLLAGVLTVVAICGCVTWIAFAASRTWTGASISNPNPALRNPFWRNQFNWTGNVAPVAGDDLTFGNSVQSASINDFPNGTTFESITVTNHLIQGAGVALNSGLSASNAQVSVASIKLNNSQTFDAPTAGVNANITSAIDTNGNILTLNGPGNLLLVGVISGTGAIRKTGLGVSVLQGANTYTGITVAQDNGTLLIFGSQPNSDVTVVSNGTLGGGGTVGSVAMSENRTGTSGHLSPGNINHATAVLNVNGNLIYSSSTASKSLDIDLNGTALGSGYDQVNVTGTVNLGTNTTLNLTAASGFNPPAGSTFVLINNDGTDAVTSTFVGRPEGSRIDLNTTSYFISYVGGDGNDVVLHVRQSKSWTGNGSNNLWSNGANWSDGEKPQVGDSLAFPAGAARLANTNDLPTTTYHSISFNGSGYQLSGQPLNLSIRLLNNTGLINSISLNIGGPAEMLLNGSMTLSGINTITGTTTISGATATVNGSQNLSPFLVTDGGWLTGQGSTGSITLGNGSTLAAGGPSSNVLTVNGSLSFTEDIGGRLLAHKLSTGLSRVNVIGPVNLTTAFLQVIDSNPTFMPGSDITIISNDGTDAVTGQFLGFPEGAIFTVSGVKLSITYRGGDGNDVVLHVPTTRTWDGGGTTDNWSDAANWVGDVSPDAGDSLVFPAGGNRLSNINDLPSLTTFNSISLSGATYNLFGNAITLSAGINDSVGNAANHPQFSSVRLAADQTFAKAGSMILNILSAIDLAGRTLTLDGSGEIALRGAISGTGSIVVNGTGRVITAIGGTNSFTGPSIINSGGLFIGSHHPNSDVQLNGGYVESFNAPCEIKSLTAAAGRINIFGGGTLVVNGNATMNSNVTFQPQLVSAMGRLEVLGSIDLGNSTLSVQPIISVPPAPGQTFTIVNKISAGPVAGRFKNLPEGAMVSASPAVFTISYVGGDGNDVVLKVPTLRRWDGGSAVDNKWTTKENWEGDVAPVSGDNLEFPAGAARLFSTNDFPIDTTFNSIVFSGAGYRLAGFPISLNAGIADTGVAGQNNRILFQISLNASQSFVHAGSTGRNLEVGRLTLFDKVLTLDGPGNLNLEDEVNGTGSIVRTDTGNSHLRANNIYTGSTTVNAGTLVIDGSQPSSGVIVNGGFLRGRGTVGPMVASGGGVVPEGLLTVSGNLAFNQDTTLHIFTLQINNALSLAKLKVLGTVNLGGSKLRFSSPNTPDSETTVIIDNDSSDPINGTFAGLPEGAIVTAGIHQYQISYVGGDGNDVAVALLPSLTSSVQFSTVNFTVSESAGQVTLTVLRNGDLSSTIIVDFRSLDSDNFTVGCADTVNNQGNAFGRCDFATVVGSLQFAPNETQKQIAVPIIDDAFAEGAEGFLVLLENPVGGGLGTLPNAVITISANDAPGLPNPIFQSPFFVRQQYLDFLSREPEANGFNAWLNVLNGCPDVNNLDANSPSASCDRIVVSQSFFGSPEFQIKGFYVFRFYKLAHNRMPEYTEIISDMSFVAGATAEEVFQRKAELAVRFTQRPEFQIAYGGLTNSAYVNTLLTRYQLTQITTPDPQQPDGSQKVTLTSIDLISQLNTGRLTRAQVFRAIADSDQVGGAEFNNAFVAMQYYGYLRRKPEPAGFNAWLGVLQGGDVRTMVNGFMNSQEYRLRFGQP